MKSNKKMSLLSSLFKLKKIYAILFFILTSISLAKSQKTSNQNSHQIKCDEGQEYVQGQCINPATSTTQNTPSFDSLSEAYIDENGVYKYIQIKCGEKIFIRGRKDCKYHKNIYNKFVQEVKDKHLNKNKCEVLGGGRINKDEKNKKIKIYGYSNRYGRAVNQHQVTKDILSKYYQNYEITWTNDGY